MISKRVEARELNDLLRDPRTVLVEYRPRRSNRQGLWISRVLPEADGIVDAYTVDNHRIQTPAAEMGYVVWSLDSRDDLGLYFHTGALFQLFWSLASDNPCYIGFAAGRLHYCADSSLIALRQLVLDFMMGDVDKSFFDLFMNDIFKHSLFWRKELLPQVRLLLPRPLFGRLLLGRVRYQ